MRVPCGIVLLWATGGGALSGEACPNQEQDTDYSGNDLKSTKASSADDCCDICGAEPGCTYWTFQKGTNGKCQLKSSDAGKKKKEGAVSGAVASAPTPPATPEPPLPPTTPEPPLPPSPPGKMPCIPLKNAAKPGTCYPTLGLGYRSPGCTIDKQDIYGACYRWPMCCKGSHCPLINATREWLKMGAGNPQVRLDTHWPFSTRNDSSTGKYNDYIGIYRGWHQTDLKREDVFLTIKSAHYSSAGKFQSTMYGHGLDDFDTKYADLYMLHNGDDSVPKHGGDGHCNDRSDGSKSKGYDARLCRIETYKGMLDMLDKGKAKALGVANFQASWLQEFKDAGIMLPAVAQYKMHLHHSTASPDVAALVKFCKDHGIVFEAYSPLGAPDYTKFDSEVGKPTLFQEDLVKGVAAKHGKSAAQVMLRWHVQQGFAAAVRSAQPDHMRENLDVFDWSLGDEDMQQLSSMPQCHQMNGNPFLDPSCPTYKNSGNFTGSNPHC